MAGAPARAACSTAAATKARATPWPRNPLRTTKQTTLQTGVSSSFGIVLDRFSRSKESRGPTAHHPAGLSPISASRPGAGPAGTVAAFESRVPRRGARCSRHRTGGRPGTSTRSDCRTSVREPRAGPESGLPLLGGRRRALGCSLPIGVQDGWVCLSDSWIQTLGAWQMAQTWNSAGPTPLFNP